MTTRGYLATAACLLACAVPAAVAAQDLQDRPAPPPAPAPPALQPTGDELAFSADTVEYDTNADIVTVTGDVRLFRDDNRLRADRVTWNRTSGQVVATGNVAVTGPAGDTAYGDRVELTDTLRDGVVDNLLIVLQEGGRLAAARGTRGDGIVTLDNAAYTACAVTDRNGCPKEPVWKIEAVRVTYDPTRERIRYDGARLTLFGLRLPLPDFSHPTGIGGGSGLLVPDIRVDRTNGLDVTIPYYFRLAPNRDLTLSPRLFTGALPMLQGEYRALTGDGAYRIAGYATSSDATPIGQPIMAGNERFRGYLDAAGRFQLSPVWSVSASLRAVTDRTFLRRYDISRDDRLRSVVNVERIDRDSYLSVAGWLVQTLRLNDVQGQQPFALPVIDYRRRLADPLLGGTIQLQANSLSLIRAEGQDMQRVFAGAQWELRRLTDWGQELRLTALARADAYNASDTLAGQIDVYRGLEGFRGRGIGALALDMRWPLAGPAFGGVQRVTPRIQLIAAAPTRNRDFPNEDSRAVDLEDINLFAINRFPGYDRFEDASRITYGLDYALDLPRLSVEATIGQSYRVEDRTADFPDGSGLFERTSDIVGRLRVRYGRLVTYTHRFRLDKDNLAVRRNEVDATIGSARTYAVLGYLRLNRDIDQRFEDLRDRQEARVGGRVAFARYWSVFGSAIVDLTGRAEDPLSISDGFTPLRHRLGFAYEDDCIELGLTWRRDYVDRGDARAGNGFLLRLSLKNLGR